MARRPRPLGVLSLCVMTLLFLASCSSDSTDASSTTAATGGSSPSPCGDIASAADGIEVTIKDFAIEPASTSAAAGEVTFDLHNEGPQTHEFVVFDTDLDPADLPTDEDGTVDEEGEGVEHIDEVEDIAACTSDALSVDLEAGNYVLICNLPGHYASGMHTAFTVS
jgi:uncharacterized cupredoxin-like copper-binding protein